MAARSRLSSKKANSLIISHQGCQFAGTLIQNTFVLHNSQAKDIDGLTFTEFGSSISWQGVSNRRADTIQSKASLTIVALDLSQRSKTNSISKTLSWTYHKYTSMTKIPMHTSWSFKIVLSWRFLKESFDAWVFTGSGTRRTKLKKVKNNSKNSGLLILQLKCQELKNEMKMGCETTLNLPCILLSAT